MIMGAKTSIRVKFKRKPLERLTLGVCIYFTIFEKSNGSKRDREKFRIRRRTIVSIGIDVLMRSHAEDAIRPSARTVAYDEWISSSDVFKKWVAAAICASVW
ncbi:hypothetical protein TNCV_4695911 [Trichonephila clavipes]|nr:hypothetical protein TNCV_4695911 [Trichonephila clavipes]